MNEKKIRLGLLGPGRIVSRVMTDMANAGHIEVAAVASRSLEKAREAAEKYHIPLAFGSYEAMAESPDVDLVYVATPHPFHEEQAVLMMSHKKGVIVEKPAAISDAQVRRMIDCAKENNVFFMEAMWTRFMPAMEKMKALLQEGAIGEVKNVYASFCYPGRIDVNDRVYNLALGSGALLDLGVYPLMAVMDILGNEPEIIHASMEKTEQGIDLRTSAEMKFANGATAQFVTGMDSMMTNELLISGSRGMIRMPGYVAPTTFTVSAFGKDSETFTYQKEHEGHHHEFEHAALCMLEGKIESPVVKWEDSFHAARICTIMRHANGLIYPQEEK